MDEPPIRQAIHYTQDVLVHRAASFRNLVIVVSLGVCGLTLISLIMLSPKFLLALCWLWPIVNGWLWFDWRRVRRWSVEVKQICVAGKLDFEVFRTTIQGMRHLPQNTLSGMLGLIPPRGSTANERSDELSPEAVGTARRYLLNLIAGIIGSALVTLGLRYRLAWCAVGLAVCVLPVIFEKLSARTKTVR